MKWDAMGEMRIFSLSGTRGVPAGAVDPLFAAVCTAIAQFFVSMSKFSLNPPPPPRGPLPVCPPPPQHPPTHFWYPPVPMQILVELEDEYMGEVHPFGHRAVVGRGKALKFFIDQLRGWNAAMVGNGSQLLRTIRLLALLLCGWRTEQCILESPTS